MALRTPARMIKRTQVATWARLHLESLGQAPILDVMVGILLLERVLDAREVVAVRRPAMLQPVFGFAELVALRLPARHGRL